MGAAEVVAVVYGHCVVHRCDAGWVDGRHRHGRAGGCGERSAVFQCVHEELTRVVGHKADVVAWVGTGNHHISVADGRSTGCAVHRLSPNGFVTCVNPEVAVDTDECLMPFAGVVTRHRLQGLRLWHMVAADDALERDVGVGEVDGGVEGTQIHAAVVQPQRSLRGAWTNLVVEQGVDHIGVAHDVDGATGMSRKRQAKHSGGKEYAFFHNESRLLVNGRKKNRGFHEFRAPAVGAGTIREIRGLGQSLSSVEGWLRPFRA